MPEYEVTAPDGRTLILEGDSPPTEAELEEIFAQVPAAVEEPAALPATRPERVALDVAGTILSGAAAEPAAGLAGIGAALTGEDPRETIAETREALTFEPRTRGGREAIMQLAEVMTPVNEALENVESFFSERGADLLAPLGLVPGVEPAEAQAVGAAAGAALPEAAGIIAGLPARAARTAAEVVEEVPGVQAPPVTVTPETAAEAVTGTVEEIAQRADIAPEVVEAAERLGIERPAAAGSRNPAFVEAIQALKSRPGSPGRAEEVAALEGLERASSQLIEDIGGTTDRTLFNDQLQLEINTNINALRDQARELYGQVNAAIPEKLEVDATPAREFIEGQIARLGGDRSLLTPPERELLRILEAEGPITYFAFDRLRKSVGQGFERQGPFKDEADANLAEVYGVLSDVQSRVADRRGVGDIYTAARGSVVQRKALEDRAVELFGKDLQKSVNQRLRTSATRLTEGNLGEFRRLINALPEHRRAEGAAQVLDQILTLGSRGGATLGPGFATRYRALRRNQGAVDELFSYLPAESRQRFEDIGTFAEAVFRAQSRENKSLTGRDVIAFLDSESALSRLYGVGRRAVATEAATSAVGLPGAGTVGSIVAEASTARTPRSQITDELLRSPEMRRAIDQAARGNIGNADQTIARSRAGRNWLGSLDAATAQQIADVGFFGWLSGQGEQE